MKQRFTFCLAVATSLFATIALADEPLCATGERTEQLTAYLQERREHQPRDRATTEAALTPKAHDGMFFLQVDDDIAPFAHGNDLIGQTVEFQPADATHYTLRHVSYSYLDPTTAPLRDFAKTPAPNYVNYNLLSTPLTLFGSGVSSVYLSAYNGIHLKQPAALNAYQIDDLHAFAQNDALISPLLTTNAKPSRLAWPKLYVEERNSALVVTWRSEDGSIFGYDVQAQLFTDGRIRFTYRSSRSMRWGAPVLSAGITPAVRTTNIVSVNDATNEIQTPSNAALKGMVDIVNTEVVRLNDSDILRFRIKVAAPIDPSKLASGEILRYIAVFGQTGSEWFDIRPDGSTEFAPIGENFIEGDSGATYSGDTITFYFSQNMLPVTSGSTSISSISRVGTAKTFDSSGSGITLPAAPRKIAQDLSATADGTLLELPITEPFTLPIFDPAAAWNEIKARFAVMDDQVDAIALYQSFYTDLIFYAGAYSANGNAGVDGIALPSSTTGSKVAKRANVMHMNTLGYGWNATDQFSGHVIMHEFGHRWLYFVRIKEGDSITSSLNPISPHPAQYIHTPAAFRVYNDYDSSVMGGAVFTPTTANGFHVRDANFSYSWTDLYLMGLASPAEVPPWFYVADTNPALGLAYYPPDDIDVTGTRHDVTIQQVIDALGPRSPSMADSPKTFKVLFALVTDPGVEPTAEEIAAMNKIRHIFEEKFKIATGGRAVVQTEFAPPGPRRRGVGH